MAKRLIEIGEKFGTWEVIAMEENDKKYNYNYVCMCVCGHKRTIRKDKLVGLTYPKCDKCQSNGLIDYKWDLISKLWDESLNGKLIKSELDIKKLYMWKCELGHRYKNSIVTLQDRCPRCYNESQKHLLVDRYKDRFNLIVEYLDKTCNELWDDVNIMTDEKSLVIWLEVNGFIVLMTSKIHNSYNDMLHGTKVEYFNMLKDIKLYKEKAIQSEKEHVMIELSLGQSVHRKDFDKIKFVLGVVNK